MIESSHDKLQKKTIGLSVSAGMILGKMIGLPQITKIVPHGRKIFSHIIRSTIVNNIAE